MLSTSLVCYLLRSLCLSKVEIMMTTKVIKREIIV